MVQICKNRNGEDIGNGEFHVVKNRCAARLLSLVPVYVSCALYFITVLWMKPKRIETGTETKYSATRWILTRSPLL